MSNADLAIDFQTYRGDLRIHCYRMTGSLEDADDLVQETFVRALKALTDFRRESSTRTWLYRIATNACIDHLRRRRRREVPEMAGEPWDPNGAIPTEQDPDRWLQPFPTRSSSAEHSVPEVDTPEKWYVRKEAVSFAFLTALQLLTPRQRAVLILRDVLDWSAEEVADLIETSVSAVKSTLHRARAAVARFSESPPGPAPEGPTPAATSALLSQYVRAWETLDIEGLVALLKEDAILAMPPFASWYRGRDAVATLLLLHPFGQRKRGGWRLVPTAVNGDPGFALYRADVPGGSHTPFGILALILQGQTEAKVSKMTVFNNPHLPGRFGLPGEIP
ncbi:MAG TPA: RNA polymerase subunit sigma-70 [Spirochaetia bacterium]|nr:RNA polymerase subunit sigma-70 [Spirochaetia bacterium]